MKQKYNTGDMGRFCCPDQSDMAVEESLCLPVGPGSPGSPGLPGDPGVSERRQVKQVSPFSPYDQRTHQSNR